MDKALSVLIVDDEFQSRELIQKLLHVHFPSFFVYEADSVHAAILKINEVNPSIIFVDVHMPGETGFDLLDNLKPPLPATIFTTAHNEFAVKAFRYAAMHYLLKPIDETEFTEAVERTFSTLQLRSDHIAAQFEIMNSARSASGVGEKLAVPTTSGYLFLTVSDILYCSAQSNYCCFHLKGKPPVVSSHTLAYYQDLLPAKTFFRIHRSYLINLDHIRMYKRGDGGFVLMTNEDELEVSRSKKDSFLRLLNIAN